MTDELRASAEEALRQFEYPSRHSTRTSDLSEKVQMRELLLKLARGIIAEHRPDDDEPVTIDFLKRMGFDVDESRFQDTCAGGDIIRHGDSMFMYSRSRESGMLINVPVKTRGQVRRLYEALAVPIEETTP